MNIEIRLAEFNEFNFIYDFYKVICVSLENAHYTPLWKIDNYPSAEDIEIHINNKEMYIAVYDNKIVGAMVVVNNCDYSSLHLLEIHPDFRKRHLSEFMMKKLFRVAKARKNHKIILDVVKGNLPAEKLYNKFGFKFVGEKNEFIERVGNICFNTYEYLL